ncbi:MAG: hypothetical protein KKE17_15545 [Proteobacteria bacterium]|nr:hypothetical protein [Pseudomonadota bacterium]MBU1711412.1 hypothetical protein [Pseudomonadota bacterium]
MGQRVYQQQEYHSDKAAALNTLGIDFAELFARRGWNLYKVDEPVTGLEALQDIIRQGKAFPAIKYQRYILLPDTDTPDNPAHIFYLMQSGLIRYPFFVDIQEDDENGTPVARAEGAYLIDSVMMTEDEVIIQVDVRAMISMGLWVPEKVLGLNNPCISFDILDMYYKIIQITKAYRQPCSEAA